MQAGFERLRSKGSHRIYGKAKLRVTVPFHSASILHPKIVKQVIETIEESRRASD
jgi:predicted RNA binding protein YcfA (HicA-like mRNA interferase family)